MNTYQVLGPKKRGRLKENLVKFDEISEPNELVLDYTTTALPPKKFFMPMKEVLLNFDIASQTAEAPPAVSGERILLGVHPCDMTAIRYLDWAFSEGQPEANWLNRRAATAIFGVTQIADDQCFSEAVKSNDPEKGYDGFFFDNGDKYVVALYTESGEKAFAGFAGAKDASEQDLANGKKHFEEMAASQKLKIDAPLASLPKMLSDAHNHAEWENVSKKCLSCGSCTNVCPTCYCFDVEDVVDLTMTKGQRIRKWDSCQLRDFTSVAGGHTFREKRETRARHRVYRKFNYLTEEQADRHAFCVGCGRCNRACTADINIVEILNNIQK